MKQKKSEKLVKHSCNEMQINNAVRLLNACGVRSKTDNSLMNLMTILIAQRDQAKGALESLCIIKNAAIQSLIDNPNDIETMEKAEIAKNMQV
jgi:hypothetical protein